MRKVSIIDSHTGGEPTRLIVAGGPELGGGPLAQRREKFQREFDRFRSAVVNEPRVSDVIVGGLVVEPEDKSCAAGVIFFNNVGYLGMCGHGTIGLVVTLAHLGKIKPGEHKIDTPVGVVTATLHQTGEVSVANVPSWRARRAVTVDVPGIGPVTGDVAWGGNWFFLIEKHGYELALANVDALTDFCWRVRQAVNAQGHPEVDHVELFGPPSRPGARSKNFVQCPGKAYDRSPCGTGTSAKLACLAADGKLEPGEAWIQESILGSTFAGQYGWLDRDTGKVCPLITGTAFVNAEATHLLDERIDFAGASVDMSKRIVIVGAGVIGLSTAYYCAKRGFAVTVIDRQAAQRDGTSFGNAGMIVPSHFIPLAAPGMVALGLKWMWNPASPFYIKPRLDAELLSWAIKFWRSANAEHVRRAAPLIRDLSFASRACYEELAAQPDMDFGLVKKGLLMVCQTEHALHEESKMAQQTRALDIPAEVLDAKQAAALDPAARMNIAGAIYFPKDCHCSPARFMAALQSALEKLGVRFIWNSEAVDFKVATDRRIGALAASGGDEVEADEFIVCGGSWSPELVRRLGVRIPMQAGKGYSLTLPKPRRLPQICSILTEARVAVTPMGSALRVGGTMEIAGLNEDINPVRVRGIIDSFCRYYPEFQPADFDGVKPWRGWRPCSPDGLPYVGRTTKFTNLSLATGHAMMGMSLGPITGRLMAEILAGEKPAFDLSLLSPDRYR